MTYELTCHSQLEGAEVAAKLVGSRDDQLAGVCTPDPLDLERVLVVIRHAHLIHPWLVQQHHPTPGEDTHVISLIRLDWILPY